MTEIRSLMSTASSAQLPGLIEAHQADPRTGVQTLVTSARNRLVDAARERQRLFELAALQRSLHAQGCAVIAGIDEVGRGALAGPVTAAAVVLGIDVLIDGLNDSKMLTPQRRRTIDATIRASATYVNVAHVWPDQIDVLGIQSATRAAMIEALSAVSGPVDHVIVDGLPIDLGRPTTAVIKGDSRVAAVAAASIVAKVARDALMVALDAEHPGYGLAHNKGYGSPDHLAALEERGPSVMHRRSFAPCRQRRLF